MDAAAAAALRVSLREFSHLLSRRFPLARARAFFLSLSSLAYLSHNAVSRTTIIVTTTRATLSLDNFLSSLASRGEKTTTSVILTREVTACVEPAAAAAAAAESVCACARARSCQLRRPSTVVRQRAR